MFPSKRKHLNFWCCPCMRITSPGIKSICEQKREAVGNETALKNFSCFCKECHYNHHTIKSIWCKKKWLQKSKATACLHSSSIASACIGVQLFDQSGHVSACMRDNKRQNGVLNQPRSKREELANQVNNDMFLRTSRDHSTGNRGAPLRVKKNHSVLSMIMQYTGEIY